MAKLEHTFQNDVLFKMVFVSNERLLKRLVAAMLGIKHEMIGEFVIKNPEIPPEYIGEKFSRLDINMTIDGQLVDIEIQVANQGDYPERSLYYWAREYSSSLNEGGHYSSLPRTIVISITAFCLFDCIEYRSEFQPLEIKRHALLTDKMSLIYFELPKLSNDIETDDEMELWLLLFKAKTEEDLAKIEAMEVSFMNDAIGAYRHVSADDEFKEIERMRSRARHNEASALEYARRQAYKEAERTWHNIVAEKDVSLAEKDASLAEKDALITELQAKLDDK